MRSLCVIDKHSNVPIYKQLMDEMIQKIETAVIKYGDKLPTERELSEELRISRGTVKKVYGELEHQGFVKIVRGSGTFVSYERKTSLEKNEANVAVDKLINQLLDQGFDHKEITSLVKLRVLNKMNEYKTINIAAVDCNVETLTIFKSQLSYMGNLNFLEFLLEDVLGFNHPKEIFADFDIIFTTIKHVEDLRKCIPELEDRIVKAAVAPDKDTTIGIFNLPSPDETAVLTRSERFADIIVSNVQSFGFDIHPHHCISIKEISAPTLKAFLTNKKALIIPPFYALEFEASVYDVILNFNREGGKIIIFNYVIERGSLIYIEEKIAAILNS